MSQGQQAKVAFYPNNDYGGLGTAFLGPQSRSDNNEVPGDADSIKIENGAYVICFNESDFTGDTLWISSSQSDLKKVNRGSDGNWKNQLKSFVIYHDKPSFWDSRKFQKTPAMPSGTVAFFENTDYNGNNQIMGGYSTYEDLQTVSYENRMEISYPGNLKNSINAISTGAQIWVIAYDGTNYSGNTLNIYPNTNLHDLNKITRGTSDSTDKGDWKNQIQSVRTYSSKPSNM